MKTIRHVVFSFLSAVLLGACSGDLAFVQPLDKQAVNATLSATSNTASVPIEIDFSGNTRARNVVLDNTLNITTAPSAGFQTAAGAGQNGWDRMHGNFAMTAGTHTLTASAEYDDYTGRTHNISKSVQFVVAAPDIWTVTSAAPATAGIAQDVNFTISVHNLGQSMADNVSILMHTALPAGFINLQTSAGFQCHLPNGYFPRFGMLCEGGTVPAQTSISLRVTLHFSTPGDKVLAVFADPDNTLLETDESNNLSNASVTIQ